MRTAVVLMLMALAACATMPGEPGVAGGTHGLRCGSVAGTTQAPTERSWVQSIDPQVALSSIQLYCMKDTPLGL
ncbi:MAG: hypothetical protein ACXWUM_11320 [Burkholderiaceae bacterium]